MPADLRTHTSLILQANLLGWRLRYHLACSKSAVLFHSYTVWIPIFMSCAQAPVRSESRRVLPSFQTASGSQTECRAYHQPASNLFSRRVHGASASAKWFYSPERVRLFSTRRAAVVGSRRRLDVEQGHGAKTCEPPASSGPYQAGVDSRNDKF